MNADTVTNKRGCISELLVTLIYGMTICRRGEFRCTGVWAQGEGGEAGLASANPHCRCSGLFSVSLAHPGLSQAEHQSAQMGRDPKGRWHYPCMLSDLCPFRHSWLLGGVPSWSLRLLALWSWSQGKTTLSSEMSIESQELSLRWNRMSG